MMDVSQLDCSLSGCLRDHCASGGHH